MADENLMLVMGATGNVVPDMDMVFTSGKGGLPVTQMVKHRTRGETCFDVASTNIEGD